MKRVICVFLLILIVFTYATGFGEMMQARSPTVIVTVRSRGEEFGRGGISEMSRQIKLSAEYSFKTTVTTGDFPDALTQDFFSGLLYSESTNDGKNEIDYSLVIDSRELEIPCSEKYYYNVKNNLYVVVECYNIELTYDNDMPVWRYVENTETEDFGVFSSDDGYNNLNEFVWKGVIGVDENTIVRYNKHKSCIIVDEKTVELPHIFDEFNLLRRNDYEEVFEPCVGICDDDWLLLGIGSRY